MIWILQLLQVKFYPCRALDINNPRCDRPPTAEASSGPMASRWQRESLQGVEGAAARISAAPLRPHNQIIPNNLTCLHCTGEAICGNTLPALLSGLKSTIMPQFDGPCTSQKVVQLCYNYRRRNIWSCHLGLQEIYSRNICCIRITVYTSLHICKFICNQI